MKSSTVWHGHSTQPPLPAGTARKANGHLSGRRPLHLANARPFGRSKAPVGLLLLRYALQMRSHPKPCLKRTRRNCVNLTQFLSTAARIPRTPLISKSFFFLVLQQKPQNDFQSCRVCADPPSIVPMVLAGIPSDSGMLLSVELGVSSGSRPVKVRMISLLFAVN